jgi:predicted PurR-regulated permease PerM
MYDNGSRRTMAAREHVVFWLSLLAAAALLLWLLADVLLPFVLGMAIGYLFDPVVAALERRGVPRAATAATLILGSYAIGIAAFVLVVPLVAEQAAALWAQLPSLIAAAAAQLRALLARFGAAAPEASSGAIERLAGPLAGFATGLVGRGLALLNVAMLLAITPLVAFYLLRDWPKVLAQVDGWLPREHEATIRAQAAEVDRVLAGFVRGTSILCVAQAVFYAVALSLVGLDYGLVVGLLAGLLSFVPYLGAAFGLATSVGLAIWQFWPSWSRVLLVLGVFVTGQILQDYVLAPRLLSSRVGLHPLWVIFAVLAGGALFGFLGVLLAVPTVAAIGVLARFAVERYTESPLYRGRA